MALEQSYCLLSHEELAEQLAQLTEAMWDEMDKLAAITAGRAALMNFMKETQEK